MYEKYQEAADALHHEKWGRKNAEAVLQRVLTPNFVLFLFHEYWQILLLSFIEGSCLIGLLLQVIMLVPRPEGVNMRENFFIFLYFYFLLVFLSRYLIFVKVWWRYIIWPKSCMRFVSWLFESTGSFLICFRTFVLFSSVFCDNCLYHKLHALFLTFKHADKY